LVGVQVFISHESLLWILAAPLDKFSTFGDSGAADGNYHAWPIPIATYTRG
jgi:hypothetical protein